MRMLKLRRMLAFCLSTLLAAAGPAWADRWLLPAGGGTVVGEAFAIHTRAQDTLLDVARRYGVGYQEITNANPAVDVWLPGDGTQVRVPRRFVLPDAPHQGIVLNIPEMRLYYYPEPQAGQSAVITHPVSIGRMDWRTPLGLTRIVAKVRNPTWYPPDTIRAEHAARGDPLPAAVPAGPDNPLGGFAMQLGIPGYLIHGTNKPRGIGMRVTHGCIRMYPEDIVRLFNNVPEGTPVRLVAQPVKVGWLEGKLFLEVHPPLKGNDDVASNLTDIVHSKIQQAVAGRRVSLDTRQVRLAIAAQSGVPVVVATSRLQIQQAVQARGSERVSESAGR